MSPQPSPPTFPAAFTLRARRFCQHPLFRFAKSLRQECQQERSLRTDPQWRHSQIYGDSKFWAPFDVEAASYNFGASDHYVPAVAMADAVGKEILIGV